MKLAIITGASSGIGAATAMRLAAENYKVVMVARNHSRLEELAGTIGQQAVVEAGDAGDGRLILEMAERVRSEHGVPDLIVNSAGAGEWKRIEDTSPEEAVTMMQAPYFAAFNLTHAFMSDMLKRNRGVIIHVNSPVSIVTWPSCIGYAATRWALRGLHEALCDDLYGTGVHSCNVIFGKVSSRYFDHNPATEGKLPGIARMIRTLSPEECADIIARVTRRPQRQVVYPLMLKIMSWNYVLFPWITRWLMRRTGVKRHILGS